MIAAHPRVRARRHVIRYALAIAAAEYALTDDPRAWDRITKAEAAMELAARDLVNTVDDSPPGQRPEGWDMEPEGSPA